MEIAAGEFKAKCLKLMDQVEKTRETVVVTKRGKPVAKLVPIEEIPGKRLFGCMAGSVFITGDIVSPQGAPAKGLDGANAWRLIPLLIKQYGRGRKTASKKIAKGHIRRVK